MAENADKIEAISFLAKTFRGLKKPSGVALVVAALFPAVACGAVSNASLMKRKLDENPAAYWRAEAWRFSNENWVFLVPGIVRMVKLHAATSVTVNITANTVSFSLSSWLTSNGYNVANKLNVQVNIATAVYVGSIQLSGLADKSQIYVVNSGYMCGAGGPANGVGPHTGGDAITLGNVNVTVTIDNTNGLILGGGGAGGYGGPSAQAGVNPCQGGGAGGGIGYPIASGDGPVGIGAAGTSGEASSLDLTRSPLAGRPYESPGGGGAGGHDAFYGNSGGDGATGGDWGQAGGNGTSSSDGVPGTAGYAGGYAVRKNGCPLTIVGGSTYPYIQGTVG